MKLHCMQSPAVSSIPRSLPFEKPFSCGQTLFNLNSCKKTRLNAMRLRFLDFGARSSGITAIKSQAQSATPSNGGEKDGNLVFVAGATGKVGSRTVRELLKLGLNVRAGVRSVERAEPLVQSVRSLKLDDVAGGAQPIDKLELVECDLEKPDRIKPALGNSSVVICCIGASEKEIFDITGPYRIDYQATKNLIDAATSAKVEHFILVTSLGTNKVGFPAAILNLFWGVLVWKRKAEEALIASGLPYTIVRPGGMERPTDSYKETHNVTLSEEDTLFGGQVSNLQVAELMAFIARNRGLSYCKVVEVIAETTAPLTPFGDLLKKIPSQRPDLYIVKEQDKADVSEPVASESTSAKEEPKPAEEEEPKPAEEEEPKPAEEEPKIIIARPLSPYAAYEDLKPPSSPTPSSSAGASKASTAEITPAVTSSASSSVEVSSTKTSIDEVIPEAAPKKAHALSPYANYEDLKPPSSPTPSASGSTKNTVVAPTPTEVAPQLTEGNDVPKVGNVEAMTVPKPSASYHSPYIAYEDLKPPTSPSPGATLEKPVDDIPESHSKPKAKPLSPYAMYEDLKPPSTPTPTPSP